MKRSYQLILYFVLLIFLTSCSARQAECVKEQIEIESNRKCIMGVPLGGIYEDQRDMGVISEIKKN